MVAEPTAAQIAQLRRMVAEPTNDTYNDAALTEYIQKYPLLDEQGEPPYYLDTSTQPPTQEDNDDWIPSWDLASAAADVWEEKAALVAGSYDVSVDGASHRLSQKYEQAMAQVRYHRSRRAAKNGTLHKWPEEHSASSMPWIGNLPEDI